MQRLRPRKPETAWRRWSASKLTAATACPLRAFYEVILEEPAPDIPIGALGKAVHYLFKLFLTQHRTTKRFPYQDRQALIGAWSHFWWGAVKGEHGFGSRREPPTAVQWTEPDQAGTMYGLGVKILKQFHENFLAVRTDGKPRWAERRFCFSWHSFTLSGIVDILEIHPDGGVIIDHKNGHYHRHLLKSGLQMTIYQLAYEKFFRPKLPGCPPLKAIRIHDYRSGEFQEVPLRHEREFGLLLSYLMQQASYFEGVLTGRWPHTQLAPNLRALDWDDISRGDITPNLPRGDHCTYCRHFDPCRARELAASRPTSREVFARHHQSQLAPFQPGQLSLPLVEQPLTRDGTRSFVQLRRMHEQPLPEQLLLPFR